MATEPENLGEPADVAERRKSTRAIAREREDAMRELMAAKSLRKWMWSLLADCKCFSTPFAVDPSVTAFACGEQNVGLKLLAEIAVACPDQYTLMMKENQNGRT